MNSSKEVLKYINLEEYCTISSSKRIYAREYVKQGIPFLRSKEVIELGRGKKISNELYITKNRFDEIRNKFGAPKKGDILLSAIGANLGIPYYVNLDYNFYFKDGNVIWFRNFNQSLNSKFLYYWINSNLGQHEILNSTIGSAQKALTIDLVKKLKIPKFNLEEQEAIANILSSLDEKMEINSKINKNLEEMAQAIYKSWFVDFEFPNEDGEPYKFSGGEMVESELGLIPKEWKIYRISDMAETVLGGTPARKNKDYWGEGHEWLKSGELNKLRIIKGTETITKLGLAKSATKLMPIGTVLIAITGYVGLTSMLEIEACANQSVVGVIPNEKWPRAFLYGLIKNEIELISAKQTGSAQQHINKNDINTHLVVSPSEDIISYFSSIVEGIHLMMSNIMVESNALRDLRNTLLPKLMSREIRIPIEE